MTKTYYTNAGVPFLVDDEDSPIVLQYNWYTFTRCRLTYIQTCKNRTVHLLHRLIMGAKPGQTVDHINGDPTDNRRSNLRFCTRIQNMANRRAIGGSSKFKGVSWRKDSRKWRAQIETQGKTRHLGSFDDELRAAEAYDEAALLIHGEFAWLNFPKKIYLKTELKRAETNFQGDSACN